MPGVLIVIYYITIGNLPILLGVVERFYWLAARVRIRANENVTA